MMLIDMPILMNHETRSILLGSLDVAVFLNDERLSNDRVIEANREEGWVKVEMRGEDGHPQLTENGTEILTETLRGTVRFEIVSRK